MTNHEIKLSRALLRLEGVYAKKAIKRIGRRLRKGKASIDLLADAQQHKAELTYNQRVFHLAYMFKKGRPLSEVENPVKTRTIIKFDDLMEAIDYIFYPEHDLQELSKKATVWFDNWKALHTTAHVAMAA